jgi:N-acetylmuramoyl-L-alanine amidase
MADFLCARREVLRLLACCGAGAGHIGPAFRRLPTRLVPQRKPAPPMPDPVIVIDPGHGGIDPGAIAPDGVYEKNIVFPTAVSLAGMLSHRYRIFLTRRANEFVPLQERVARACAWHADLFVSIHANALPSSAMRGLSVFTLSDQPSDKEAAALAQSENRDIAASVDLKYRSPDVGNILLDLERRQTDNQSIALAHDVVTALRQQVVLLDNPERSAHFVVLTAPAIPSVLVELGCLSNPVEGRLLQRPAYQERLARGLAEAVESYFAVHRSSGTESRA